MVNVVVVLSLPYTWRKASLIWHCTITYIKHSDYTRALHATTNEVYDRSYARIFSFHYSLWAPFICGYTLIKPADHAYHIIIQPSFPSLIVLPTMTAGTLQFLDTWTSTLLQLFSNSTISVSTALSSVSWVSPLFRVAPIALHAFPSWDQE